MKHSEKNTKYEHFNAVYAGSYAAVLRWIRSRVPADLAEELTQQTFMQYWQWLLAAAAFPKSDKSLLLSIVRRPLPGHCCPGGVRGNTGGL
jgi:DNA-directed RNA polymerase specialized sigma24 family protein